MNVIFDLGNVILDWNVQNILDRMGLEDRERRLLKKELFDHSDWLSLDEGLQTEKAVLAQVMARAGLSQKLVEHAFSSAKNSLRPIPESVNLLEEIGASANEVYCLSNMSQETYAHICDYEFFRIFDGVVISAQEKCMKPNGQIFRIIIDRYDLSPEETLFIDDNIENIEAARQLGMSGYHFEGKPGCFAAIRSLLK